MKFMRVESGILGFGIQNPDSTDKDSLQYLESGIHSLESRIQDCLGFPYMGQKEHLTFMIRYQIDLFGLLNVVPNSNLLGIRFFMYCHCIIMWNSHLNDMEIPQTKSFIPKGFELGTTLVSRIGLFVIFFL